MKKTVAIIVVVVLMLSLVACGSLSSGDLIGVWSGSWEYEGKRINVSIQFSRDGSFATVSYHDGELAGIDEGSYTIKGNKVDCYSTKTLSTCTYKYIGGNLINNGHSLSKE